MRFTDAVLLVLAAFKLVTAYEVVQQPEDQRGIHSYDPIQALSQQELAQSPTPVLQELEKPAVGPKPTGKNSIQYGTIDVSVKPQNYRFKYGGNNDNTVADAEEYDYKKPIVEVHSIEEEDFDDFFRAFDRPSYRNGPPVEEQWEYPQHNCPERTITEHITSTVYLRPAVSYVTEYAVETVVQECLVSVSVPVPYPVPTTVVDQRYQVVKETETMQVAVPVYATETVQVPVKVFATETLTVYPTPSPVHYNCHAPPCGSPVQQAQYKTVIRPVETVYQTKQVNYLRTVPAQQQQRPTPVPQAPAQMVPVQQQQRPAPAPQAHALVPVQQPRPALVPQVHAQMVPV